MHKTAEFYFQRFVTRPRSLGLSKFRLVCWGHHAGVLRVGIRDRKVEQLASLKGFQMTGYFGLWLGIAPDDSPLLLKDTGTQEIVSLDWQAP